MAEPVRARIERNLLGVRERIAAALTRSGRSGPVRLVAVTKSADLPAIRALVELGLTDLGESRVPQLIERAAEIAEAVYDPSRLTWHMVGHLQRNKVRAVLDVAGLIHSVDSLRLAEEINTRAERLGRRVDVLMQVNCSREAHKFGVAVGAAGHLAELIGTLRSLNLLGLMTMAPLEGGPEAARPSFCRLRELFEEMRHEKIVGPGFEHLSMGMSQDYEVAVEEGATIVRIGTALFG